MKRFIAVFLAVLVLLLTGCSIPFFGKSSDKPLANVQKDDMITLQEGTQADATGENSAGLHGSATGNEPPAAGKDADGPVSGTSPGTASNTAPGWVPGAAEGITTGQAGITAKGVLSGTGIGMDETAAIQEGNQAQAEDDAQDGLPENEMAVQDAENRTDSSTYFAEPRRPVTVYYQDADGCVIPMTRWIRPQTGIARAALSLAIDNTIAREEVSYYGVYPVIPAGTEILGIDVRDGIATVDFSRHLLNYGSAVAERNIITSIVYMLTEFETIDKVRILINGYPQSILKYGTDLTEALGRKDIMINTYPHMAKTGVEKVDVFLLKQANTGFTYPVPFSVAVVPNADDLPELLVKQLLAAEDEGGLFNEIPEGVRLLGCDVANGVITLNFSGEFVNYGGTEREEGILKQLAYTLRQCEGIRRIKIMVEGRTAELPEGTDISGGLTVPATINDVMDR